MPCFNTIKYSHRFSRPPVTLGESHLKHKCQFFSAQFTFWNVYMGRQFRFATNKGITILCLHTISGYFQFPRLHSYHILHQVLGIYWLAYKFKDSTPVLCPFLLSKQPRGQQDFNCRLLWKPFHFYMTFRRGLYTFHPIYIIGLIFP